MDYQRIYSSLIERARNRILEAGVYSEKHHVIPRCMGGGDEAENLVRLLAREHYVCHQLLVKIYPEVKGLTIAAHLMSMKHVTSKKYEWLRIKHSKILTGSKQSLNTINKRILKNTGKKRPSHAIEASRLTNLGRVCSEDTKNKIRISITGKKLSEKTKEKLSKVHAGKSQSPEHIQKRISSRLITLNIKNLAKQQEELNVQNNQIPN